MAERFYVVSRNERQLCKGLLLLPGRRLQALLDAGVLREPKYAFNPGPRFSPVHFTQ